LVHLVSSRESGAALPKFTKEIALSSNLAAAEPDSKSGGQEKPPKKQHVSHTRKRRRKMAIGLGE
jgi:hypothetical protein